MRKEFVFIIVIVLCTGFLLVFKQMYAGGVRAFFAPPSSSISTAEADLIAENKKLKAELAELNSVKSQLPQNPQKSITAIVYSRYPLNFKSELLVNAGAVEKISLGKAVTFAGMLVGRVSEVFNESSLVQTIFDERFQIPVKVGNGAADALFKGGLSPTLDLISLTAAVQSGDIVYSAGADFPYGLPVAEIKEVRFSDDKLFRVATLDIPYDVGQIGAVFITQ